MSKTMLAGIFEGPGQLTIAPRAQPELPAADWLRIEVEGCGVCGTDLHILADPPGHPANQGVILGHEFVGHVVETGPDVLEFSVGDRVTVAPNLTCGKCRQCKAGRSNHCERWTTIGVHRDGGFARYVVAPERSVHPVASALPLAEAIWIEPLSCVVNGTDVLGAQPGQTAVVIGAGPIGGLHGLVFRAAGAQVIVADVAPFRLELMRRAGMDMVVDVTKQELREAVLDMTGGLGADIVVDAVGNQFGTAIEVAAKGGRISLFGMDAQARPAVAQSGITRNELTVFGTYVGAHTFPRAIAMLESGAVRPSVMNSLIAPLSEMVDAVAAARSGDAMKVIILPS